jgi:hypothetical protein
MPNSSSSLGHLKIVFSIFVVSHLLISFILILLTYYHGWKLIAIPPNGPRGMQFGK